MEEEIRRSSSRAKHLWMMAMAAKHRERWLKNGAYPRTVQTVSKKATKGTIEIMINEDSSHFCLYFGADSIKCSDVKPELKVKEPNKKEPSYVCRQHFGRYIGEKHSQGYGFVCKGDDPRLDFFKNLVSRL